MTYDSFTYNGIDVYELARLKMVSYNTFTAPLRPRKQVIPGRSGAFDFGAKYHDERTLRMSCTIDGEITDSQFDSLKFTLSRKGRIILWDQLDRYYYGQSYDATEVIDYYRHCMREFEINFVCDPYAYALEPTVLTTSNRILPVAYEGTRETPTRITIRNTGTASLVGLTLIARERTN